MSEVNNIIIPVQYRKCVNEKSTGYGKYYGEVRNKRPLSMMGFCNHMKMHGLAYGIDVIYAVVKKITQCLPELLAEGQPVILDGLGKFYASAQSASINESDLQDSGYNAASKIKGVHIRFLPTGVQIGNLTSKAYLRDHISLDSQFVVESVTRTVNGKQKKISTLKTLEDWRTAPAPQP